MFYNMSYDNVCESGSSVLLILTRGHDLSRSAIAVLDGNCKFSLPPSHLAPSFEVIHFKFMK